MDKNRMCRNSFSSDNMAEFIKKCSNQKDLIPLYLHHIRNGRELTEEMLLKIADFDSSSKMKIIVEYNKCIKMFADSFN